MTGVEALPAAAGLKSAPARYAIAARRHMETYGTTSEQLGRSRSPLAPGQQ